MPLLQDLLSEFITLFVIIDPIGALPLFISLTGGDSLAERRGIAVRAVAIAFVVLLFFIVAGQVLLQALHVHILSFQLSGSIILFLFALTLVFGIRLGGADTGDSVSQTARAVFPLSIPAIAGPGAMLTVVLLTDNDRFSVLEQAKTSMTLAAVLLVTLGLLWLANPIVAVIGRSGTLIVSRIMGLILASIAVENGVTVVTRLAAGG